MARRRGRKSLWQGSPTTAICLPSLSFLNHRSFSRRVKADPLKVALTAQNVAAVDQSGPVAARTFAAAARIVPVVRNAALAPNAAAAGRIVPVVRNAARAPNAAVAARTVPVVRNAALAPNAAAAVRTVPVVRNEERVPNAKAWRARRLDQVAS